MHNSNVNNFQQNNIQGGLLFQQMQLKNQLKNLEINDDDQQEINGNQHQLFMNNNTITESFTASIVGLKIEYHNKTKLKNTLEKQFNCRASIIEKEDGDYGVQLYFKNNDTLNNFMGKKFHILKFDDDSQCKLSKKPHKYGNRFYVKYEYYY